MRGDLASCLIPVCLCATVALAADPQPPAPAAPVPPPDRQAVIRYAAESGEGTWKKTSDPRAGLSSRELFTYALALAEAGEHPERFETLFAVAAKMQDRDSASRGYGNFRWDWEHDRVIDFNAVEFCMQGGAILWMRHRDRMPAAAKTCLREILQFGVEGCLRHRVRPGYTNIALMNAENLILLGETLDMPKMADEGYSRLSGVVLNTWDNGITEYGSPTYYGVDLDCLVLIEAFCTREQGRRQARALLELFWTDIALNYFPPSQRLAGPHSRDYDYMRGRGIIENHLWMAGWLAGPPRGSIGAVWPALGRWQPPASLYEMSRMKSPRLIRQMWGTDAFQSRTHCLLPDITLGSAGANYHNMDLPLTVDLPGPIDFPRCYFIPDCRHDPYGKVKIPEGSGAHSKTLHLRPFWVAAQKRCDALGLGLYRQEDMLKTATTLESHFVMPRDVDGFWIGDRQVTLKADAPATCAVADGEALVLRKGTAAVGIRVPWTRGVEGKPASVALVDDGNAYGVVRLTVTHYESRQAVVPSVEGAGAAFWVRVGSGLATDEAFHAWRRQFSGEKAGAETASGKLSVTAAGADGPISIQAAYPAGGIPVADPPPARTILDMNGEDIGRRILAPLEPEKLRPPEKKAK